MPVELNVAGKLPDFEYNVMVDVHAVAGIPAKERASVTASIARWVIAEAPALGDGSDRRDKRPSSITGRPAGVPFDVTLSCVAPCQPGVLFVMRYRPANLDEQRLTAVSASLDRKCPKLAAARAEFEAHSVLVLESDDIAIASRNVINSAVQLALEGRPTTDYPDVVLLVETDCGLQWELSVLRDRQRLVRTPNDGPFRLRRVTTH